MGSGRTWMMMVFGLVGACLISFNLAANIWPDEATKDRLAKKHQVPRAFWDLPFAQQVRAKALDAFYVQKFTWQGQIKKTSSRLVVGEEDRLAMAQYLVRKFQEPFHDPHSPLYRQALVSIIQQKMGNARHVLALLKANPSLPKAQQGPVAKFLAKLEAEFGNRLQIALDPYAVFLQGARAAFYPVGRTPQIVQHARQVGWINLGLPTSAAILALPPDGVVEEEATLAHELIHARTFHLQLQGGYNYFMGRLMANNRVAQDHQYQGSFDLDEIPAYFARIHATLRDLRQRMALEQEQPRVSLAKQQIQKIFARWRGDRLAPPETEREYLIHQIEFGFRSAMDFLELLQAVSDRALQVVHHAVPQEDMYPWERLVNNAHPAAVPGVPYYPYISGMIINVELGQNFKYVRKKRLLPQPPAHFSYLVPYNVLSEISGVAAPAKQVAKFKLFDLAVFDQQAAPRKKQDDVALRKIRQLIYHPQAASDLKSFLSHQQDYLDRLLQIMEPIYEQWIIFRANPAGQTTDALEQMLEDFGPAIRLMEAPEGNVTPEEYASGLVGRPCARQLK